jgi:hypothetical protein
MKNLTNGKTVQIIHPTLFSKNIRTIIEAIESITPQEEMLEIPMAEVLNKYDFIRMGNNEIYRKLSEQISNFQLGSAECLLIEFYKSINPDLLYFQQELKTDITKVDFNECNNN